MANKIQIDLNRVEELASQGLTQVQISSALGISDRILYRRKQDLAGLSDALKKGQAKGIIHVTNKLREKIDNGNTTAIIFFLKTRAGWKETCHIEQESRVEVLNSMNDLFEDRETKN